MKMGDEDARGGGRYWMGVLCIYCVVVAIHVAGSGAWPVYAPGAFQTNHMRPSWAQTRVIPIAFRGAWLVYAPAAFQLCR